MYENKILSTFILPQKRGQKTKCQICSTKFQVLIKQEHMCKRCRRSICQKCGNTRDIVYQADGKNDFHRTCCLCVKQNANLKNHCQKYKLCFAQDSEFVEQWLKKLNKERKNYQQIINQFQQSQAANNDNLIRFKRQSQTIFNQVGNCINYSFRHFIKLISKNTRQNIVFNKVKNVVIGIFGYLKNIPYIPELVLISIFFLCYASQAHSYFLITRLIEKNYPQYLRIKKMKKDNLLQNQLKVIIQMYKILCPHVERAQIQVIGQYLQTRFQFYLITFTLNTCQVLNSFLLLDQMLKTGSYLVIYKGIAVMLACCRSQLSSFQSYSQLQLQILKRVSLDYMKKNIISFDKSEMKFQVNHQVFDSAEHRKLFQKFRQIQQLYQRSLEGIKMKDDKVANLTKQLNDKKALIQQLKRQVLQLSQEVLVYSGKVPDLINLKELQVKYSQTEKQNKILRQKQRKLIQKIQEMQLKKYYQKKQHNYPQTIQSSYTTQIVNLKTENQILKIKLAAKDIDFNTSFIDSIIKQKNQYISQLEKSNQKLQKDVSYYQQKNINSNLTKALTNFFIVNQNKNQSQEKETQNLEKNNVSPINKKTFQFHIQSSKKIITRLKENIQQNKKKTEQLNSKLITLQKKLSQQSVQIEKNKGLVQIIKQIKEEANYIDSLNLLKSLIEKQQNFMKKGTLVGIKQSFERCEKQVQYRTIQYSLLKNKIDNQKKKKESIQQKLMQQLNFLLQSSSENVVNLDQIHLWNQTNDSLINNLKQKDQNGQKRDLKSNDQCQIM